MVPKARIIVLLGPPAGGKGTLAHKITERMGIRVITPGNIYARLREEDTPLGQLVRKSLEDGGYCPSDLTNQIMFEETQKALEFQDNNLLIFDGYPRTKEQYDFLLQNFDILGWLHVHAPYETLLEASVNRRSCSTCKYVFSAKNPPAKCGGDRAEYRIDSPCAADWEYNEQKSWNVRFDDGLEFYPKRYDTYQNLTLPIINLIKNYNNYRKVQLLGGTKMDEQFVYYWIEQISGIAEKRGDQQFTNLAGKENSNADILNELYIANVDAVWHAKPLRGEVITHVSGELDELVFTRNFNYWVVKGNIPSVLAERIYAVKERRDIRAGGHGLSPSPESEYYPTKKEIDALCAYELSNKGKFSEERYRKTLNDIRYIKMYHIDTQQGLNFFVQQYNRYKQKITIEEDMANYSKINQL